PLGSKRRAADGHESSTTMWRLCSVARGLHGVRSRRTKCIVSRKKVSLDWSEIVASWSDVPSGSDGSDGKVGGERDPLRGRVRGAAHDVIGHVVARAERA